MLDKEFIAIDSHCHAGESWYEPIEALCFHLDQNRITKAVLIGHMGAYENNDYLLECKNNFPDRFAIVGVFDLNNLPNKNDDFNNLELHKFDGVRIAAGNIIKPEYRPVLETISELGLVISCLGEWPEFNSQEFIQIAAENPELNIVIEHLAGIGHNFDYQKEYCEQSRRFVNYDNIYIKIPGLGEINNKPDILFRKSAFDNKSERLLEITLRNFGSKRMMWGSDYPPVSGREGYTNSFKEIFNSDVFQNHIDLSNIIGGTAHKLFF